MTEMRAWQLAIGIGLLAGSYELIQPHSEQEIIVGSKIRNKIRITRVDRSNTRLMIKHESPDINTAESSAKIPKPADDLENIIPKPADNIAIKNQSNYDITYCTYSFDKDITRLRDAKVCPVYANKCAEINYAWKAGLTIEQIILYYQLGRSAEGIEHMAVYEYSHRKQD